MTYLEVYQMVSGIRVSATTTDTIPCAYFQFPDDDPSNPAPPPPFLVYYWPESSDFMADNINYQAIRNLTIELYCDNKNFLLEQAVEDKLKSCDCPFYKSEAYIESEKLYMTTYNTEVLING